MLYYTVRRWPLGRVLLAQSLTIAVALVIELGIMGQGRAQCYCREPFVRGGECPMEPKAPVRARFPGDLPSGTLEGVVVWASRNEPHPLSKETDETAISRAREVWKLESNNDLKKFIEKERMNTKADGKCICFGDQICFKNFLPVSQVRLRTVVHVHSRKARVCKYGGMNIKGGKRLVMNKRTWICEGRTGRWYWLRKVYGTPPRH
jgi:hypothetical protein